MLLNNKLWLTNLISFFDKVTGLEKTKGRYDWHFQVSEGFSQKTNGNSARKSLNQYSFDSS